MKGEQFLERLREQDGRALPVIVVTVKDLTQPERAALNRLHVSAKRLSPAPMLKGTGPPAGGVSSGANAA